MAAIGAWLGISQGLTVLCGVCFSGVALALVWAKLHGRLSSTLASLHGRAALATVEPTAALQEQDAPPLTMPYAPAILLGVVAALLWVAP